MLTLNGYKSSLSVSESGSSWIVNLKWDTNNYEQEKKELPNVHKELKKGFAQEGELKLTRENHSAVLRELKHMQEDTGYVSEWKPKTMEEFRLENPIVEVKEELTKEITVKTEVTQEVSFSREQR